MYASRHLKHRLIPETIGVMIITDEDNCPVDFVAALLHFISVFTPDANSEKCKIYV